MIRSVIAMLILALGLAGGYWLSKHFNQGNTDKIYVALEKAVAQSKFNLVKDNYVEMFYLCEQGNLVNNWKALMLVGYTFQYGVDAKNLVMKVGQRDEQGRVHIELQITQIETLSSEISFLRAFTLDKALLKNQEALVSQSKDDLVKRRQFLAELRLYSKESADIQQQLTMGISNTVLSLANALGSEIVIDKIILPEHAPPIQHVGTVRYQCGDISPVSLGADKTGPGTSSLEMLFNNK